MRSTSRRLLLFLRNDGNLSENGRPFGRRIIGNRPDACNRFARPLPQRAKADGGGPSRSRTCPAVSTPGPLHWLRHGNTDAIEDDALEVIISRLARDLA